jgi:hypothetical protein
MNDTAAAQDMTATTKSKKQNMHMFRQGLLQAIAYIFVALFILFLYVAAGLVLGILAAPWPTKFWPAIGLIGLLSGYGFVIFLPDLLGRCVQRARDLRMFRDKRCPACQAIYDRRSIRMLRRTLQVQGSNCRDVMELTCRSCSHKQEYDENGKAIPHDESWSVFNEYVNK